MAQLRSIAASFLILLTLAASPASAEIVISYFLSLQKNCSGGAVCKLIFPTTPANRRVDLSHVSCNNAAVPGPLLATVLYLNPAGLLAQIRLVPHPTEQGLNTGFLYDQALPLPVSAGRRIEIEVVAGSDSSIVLICTLMGKLVFLP